MNDPYSVLGITPGADEETIKKAYRQKCKQYHPDLHPDDPTCEDKFKDVQAAYSEVMRMRSGGGSSASSSGSSSYYGQRSSGSSQQQYQDPFGFGFGFDPLLALAAPMAGPAAAMTAGNRRRCRPPTTISATGTMQKR